MTNESEDKIELEVSEKGGKVAVIGGGTARLINAVADFVSPITQSLGAVGDLVRQFRVYREMTATIVLEQAAAKLRQRGASPASIPPKVLIPTIEKASLEAPDDDEMIGRWSELLASMATDGAGSDQAILIDILGRMSSNDARMLDDIAMKPVVNIGAFSQIANAPLSRRNDSCASLIRTHRGENWERLCAKLVIRTETRGSAFVRLYVWDEKSFEEEFYYSRKARGESDIDPTLDRLKILGLVDIVEERILVRARHKVTYASVYLSHVGTEFFYRTHDPQLREVPSERRVGADISDADFMPANGSTFSSKKVLADLLKSDRFRVGVNHVIPPEPNDY